MATSSGTPRGKLPPELRDVVKARQRVDRLRAELADAIRERNDLARAAKEAGHPAGKVYQLAGIHESTFSRRKQAGGSSG